MTFVSVLKFSFALSKSFGTLPVLAMKGKSHRRPVFHVIFVRRCTNSVPALVGL